MSEYLYIVFSLTFPEIFLADKAQQYFIWKLGNFVYDATVARNKNLASKHGFNTLWTFFKKKYISDTLYT